jgi:hypothetical protein
MERTSKTSNKITTIKTSYPTEQSINLVIADKIDYQSIISTMEVISGDTPKQLFPDITLQESLQ